MIFIFGISITIFLTVLLMLKKEKNKAEKVLLFWFFVIAIHQSLFYFDYLGTISDYGFLIGVIIPFPFLHGPLLYTHTSILIRPSNDNKKSKYWIHFIPFILLNIYLIHFYLLPTSDKLYVANNNGEGYELFIIINLILIVFSGIGYILKNLFLLKKHQKNIKQEYSNIDKINLKWLQYLSYGLLLIWIVIPFGSDIHISFTVTLFVLVIGVKGILQGHIFVKQMSLELNVNIDKDKFSKKQYSNSGLTKERRTLIKNNLEELMTDEKIYLNPELSLTLLASKLNIQSNYISQYINEELGVSFYEYINTQRVNEFKNKIAEPKYQHYKIIEVAYECGFNSKSSFNRIFRRITEITPSEYWKSINHKDSKSYESQK